MKSLTIIIAALVITLILNGPLQSYADPQLDTLVNIATQARNSLNISISQIPNVSDKITSLYKQGSSETDALTQAANKQDIASAKQHFLSAMNFFKTTNDEINSLNATEVNDQQRVNIIQLQSEITRLEKITETLQTIAITNHVDFNFTQLNTSIQNAKQDLDAGNVGDASKLIDLANQLIVDAHHSLSETAQQMTTDRAKDFTEKQIERYDKIGELNATNSATLTSNVTMSKTNSNLTSTENPGEMIAKLRKLVSEGNVDEALKVIKSLDAYQKETLKNNENQTESQSGINAQNNTVVSPNSNSTTISSNVTTINSPINNTSNATTASSIKTSSFHRENSNFSFTHPSNITKTIPLIPHPNIAGNDFVKTNSSNNNNSTQSNNDRKTDKTSSFHGDSNQQNKDNNIASQMISPKNLDSEQQDKTHEQQNHEKILNKQNKEKRNHD